MIRMAKPSEFLRELSGDARLKFLLAWLTFAELVLPTALLMSLGFPEKYALPLMLVATPPFQYGAFCILRSREGVRTDRERSMGYSTPVVALPALILLLPLIVLLLGLAALGVGL